jgi:hypothetical protein
VVPRRGVRAAGIGSGAGVGVAGGGGGGVFVVEEWVELLVCKVFVVAV